ncbi:aldehyde dehydrogenase [Chondrinema litorale]|uniref:aldehyde dehydrogenase n=1 Tax=Chondrinema litorale TaxID=2994555 RepID=UPI0025431F1D|nr:aldehyde dehydrogenase [Chondrinema litorale]UZR92643.1 aldehyde dehydrogenase [Chondrinema litorale]
MEKLLNYIDGELQEPVSGNFIENINPATGEAYALIPDSDENDVNLAVEAANKASESWSTTTVQERSEWMLKIAEIIDANADTLALVETNDTGKPINLSKTVDIPRAAANMRFFATAILHTTDNAHITNQQAINYTKRHPLGVVGCISPWNLPLYLFTWKIAPALATGNTVIAKPSELTPATAFLFSKICKEVGLPKGVLNIVHGYGDKAGAAIVSHEDVNAISFTGGTATGSKIASVCAPSFKKVSLELGGKNPFVVFDDCNLENTVETAVRASFSNQGQICLCGSRILVHESCYESFKNAFLAKTKELKIGDPLVPFIDVGAVISNNHSEKILSYIDLAIKEGGKILTGGNKTQVEGRCTKGNFITPTIIENLSANCRVNQEEIFGPVVSLMKFKDEKEAITLANDSKYGLAASVWTNDINKANRVSSAIKCGIVWVNCWMLRDLRTPFGGMKQSGLGREGGEEALRFFTEPQNICIQTGS